VIVSGWRKFFSRMNSPKIRFIFLLTRSVMEYLLSSIQKVVHEAGRER
jgi:hypothetical protein